MAPFLLAASLLVPIVTKVDSSGFLCVAGLHLPSACPKSSPELGGWRCKCCRVGQCRGISPGHVEGSRNLIGFGWRSFGFLSLQVFGTDIFTWTPSLHAFFTFYWKQKHGNFCLISRCFHCYTLRMPWNLVTQAWGDGGWLVSPWWSHVDPWLPGLLKFKSWELLDPSSTRALERAHKQPFRNYLNEYVDFHQSGRAKDRRVFLFCLVVWWTCSFGCRKIHGWIPEFP